MDLSTGSTLFLNGLALGAILFLLASGLTMIFGLLNVVNFAHGAYFLVGAYVAVETVGKSNVIAGLIAAAVAVALVGFLTERFLLRRFYGETERTSHLRQLLLTLGLTMILTELVQIIVGPDIRPTGDLGALNDPVSILGGYVELYRLLLIGVGILVFLLLHWLLQRTRIGLVVRAGVHDHEMVEALGIDVWRAFSAIFVIGSAMAGFAGAAAVYYYKGAAPTLGDEHLVLAFGIVVVGGLGSYVGSAVGAVLVGLLTSFISYFWLPGQSFVVLGLLAIVLLIRPQGLFGKTVVRV
jgi:branched-chain amino acid transport system permease protein